MVLMQPDPFLSELTNMYERGTEKGSVWVTMNRSSLKDRLALKKMEGKGEAVGYRCLVCASNGKKNISTSVWLFLGVFLMVTSLTMCAAYHQFQAQAQAHAAATNGFLGH